MIKSGAVNPRLGAGDKSTQPTQTPAGACAVKWAPDITKAESSFWPTRQLATIDVGDISPRVPDSSLDQAHVNKLAEAMRAGNELPIVVVSQQKNGKYAIEDGHNRLAAYKQLGGTKIPVAVVPEDLGTAF